MFARPEYKSYPVGYSLAIDQFLKIKITVGMSIYLIAF